MAISKWLKTSKASPVTGAPLTNTRLHANIVLRKRIADYIIEMATVAEQVKQHCTPTSPRHLLEGKLIELEEIFYGKAHSGGVFNRVAALDRDYLAACTRMERMQSGLQNN